MSVVYLIYSEFDRLSRLMGCREGPRNRGASRARLMSKLVGQIPHIFLKHLKNEVRVPFQVPAPIPEDDLPALIFLYPSKTPRP